VSAEIHIREARSEDAPRLKQLINDLGHPIEVADVIRNLDTLSSIGLLPLVATEGDRIVGMCGLSAMTTVHRDAPVGRVSVMIVDEAYRGRKIGALLLAKAERMLAERGCKILEVTSNMKRDRAHHFYEELGYERTSYRFMKRL
jgi:GNAT superfamily N-acetyltransferase